MSYNEQVITLLEAPGYKPLKVNEIASSLKIPHEAHNEFLEALSTMEQEGLVVKVRKNHYELPSRLNMLVGRFQGNSRGFGFLIVDGVGQEDIFINADNVNSAMHNDRIMVRVFKAITGKRKEGEVIKVLSRANDRIIGTYESSKHFGFVVPDDRKIFQDIFIPKEESRKAKDGQKVVVEITQWPDKRRNPEGKVIEIIGHADAPGVDVESIIRKYQFNVDFPYEVMQEVKSVSTKVTEEQIKGRVDLRELRMVTIDGEDAKDLDDAVSIQKIDDNTYRLGVHIADVGYYVPEGSELDKEAYNRGTSVYLVDRVIPMLPRELSNGICSLNAGEDRLAMSVFADIDKNGKILKHEILDTVINVNERMTYKNVAKILIDKDEELIKRYAEIIPDLEMMNELRDILRKKRYRRGSINFEFPEAKVRLDENGKPIDIYWYETTIANEIIEEFMIAANEVVSEDMSWRQVPFLYRIHEEPNQEKIDNLNTFIYNFGYFVKGANKIHPKAIQEVLEQVEGKPEERVINTIALRAMKQARYSAENIGHFGLASKFYSHFTSPIRRYPDLVIHRIIRETLRKGLSPNRMEFLERHMPDIALQSSERERAAAEAERESLEMKKVQFMLDKVGQNFAGIISSVTSFGMFVELDNSIEGLVHVTNMLGDYYNYDEKNLTLTGERTRKTYRIGQRVEIEVLSVNPNERQIDFVLVSENPKQESVE